MLVKKRTDVPTFNTDDSIEKLYQLFLVDEKLRYVVVLEENGGWLVL